MANLPAGGSDAWRCVSANSGARCWTGSRGQYCGKHWGPDLAGQVDTGMATGNSLAALEAWLAYDTVA